LKTVVLRLNEKTLKYINFFVKLNADSYFTIDPFSKLGNFFTICLNVGSSDFSKRNAGLEPGSLSVHAY
jgi:hypothetical protein